MAQQVATDAPVRYMQGIAVPEESVQPARFFALTRRHRTVEKSESFVGLGQSSNIELKKADILSGILVKFSGSLVVATSTINTSALWPYGLINRLRFTANGQSNVINARGLQLKAREFMAHGDKQDRGISNTVAGVARTQGTLAQASESWGVGSNTTAIGTGTYAVELFWWVPIAEDEVDLSGAIFAATSSTDLTLQIDWEQSVNLFAGAGTATLTGTVQYESTKFSIPVADGMLIVPDLSLFHSIITARTSSIANGDNETRTLGQGAGKTLLRIGYQTWNGAGFASAPLPMNATNFGRQSWRYAGNETPDEYFDGQMLREVNERDYQSDIGGIWGFGVHDFANENAFRDAIDMGTTSEFRLFSNITNTPTLSNAFFEYFAETVYYAGAGA